MSGPNPVRSSTANRPWLVTSGIGLFVLISAGTALARTRPPTPMGAPCPQATPEPLWVEPVTSPTDQLAQTILVRTGNSERVEVNSESGTFVVTGDLGSSIEIRITLLPNTTHHLRVTTFVKRVVGPQGCVYGGYSLQTTWDRYGNPLVIVQGELGTGPTTTPTPTPTRVIPPGHGIFGRFLCAHVPTPTPSASGPDPGLEIMLLPAERSTVSDSERTFRFFNVPDGSYTLHIVVNRDDAFDCLVPVTVAGQDVFVEICPDTCRSNDASPTDTPTPGSIANDVPPTPTDTPASCIGDVNGDGAVLINELVMGIEIALGRRLLADAPTFDADASAAVEVNEIVLAVRHAMQGCPPSRDNSVQTTAGLTSKQELFYKMALPNTVKEEV